MCQIGWTNVLHGALRAPGSRQTESESLTGLPGDGGLAGDGLIRGNSASTPRNTTATRSLAQSTSNEQAAETYLALSGCHGEL
jgi:hypothetical protein